MAHSSFASMLCRLTQTRG